MRIILIALMLSSCSSFLSGFAEGVADCKKDEYGVKLDPKCDETTISGAFKNSGKAVGKKVNHFGKETSGRVVKEIGRGTKKIEGIEINKESIKKLGKKAERKFKQLKEKISKKKVNCNKWQNIAKKECNT